LEKLRSGRQICGGSNEVISKEIENDVFVKTNTLRKEIEEIDSSARDEIYVIKRMTKNVKCAGDLLEGTLYRDIQFPLFYGLLARSRR